MRIAYCVHTFFTHYALRAIYHNRRVIVTFVPVQLS
jgi:hypothetical protein